MADNKNQSGAKHLTSLDFDLSRIWQQFEELQNQLPEKAKEIGLTVSSALRVSTEEALRNSNITTMDNFSNSLVNTEKFKRAKEELDKIAKTYGKLAESVIKYNEATGLFSGDIKYTDDKGNKLVARYKEEIVGAGEDAVKEWTSVDQKMTESYEKQEKLAKRLHEQEIKDLAELRTYEERLAQEKAEQTEKEILKSAGVREAQTLSKKEQLEISAKFNRQIDKETKDLARQRAQEEKIKDDFYKKNLTQIDLEIQAREKQAKQFSMQLKEQMMASQTERELKDKLLTQANKMIEKQKDFANEVKKYSPSVVNKEVIADNEKLLKSLDGLIIRFQKGEITSKEFDSGLQTIKTGFSELDGRVDKTVGGVDNFLKVLGDKARWLLAFKLITAVTQAFKETLETVKETEDSVVELQRVMNTDVSQSKISKGLYDIATTYGRTFDEVQEVAVKFAQTGMEWNDVLTATRNTMLALNTAELDVTSSTEGLIAIQSQWKLQTDDLIDVIDKINITADNFTVTSEKLVAALQRVSGTAKNAGLSLDQTIGVITALSEATGRSGENIGTALNSLIAYTQKESSLNVFAGLSEGMEQTVKDFNKGAVSIYDLWSKLAKELNALSKEQQTYLLQSITQDTAYSDFAEELETQATDVTKSIKEVYKTAGTFRQNYFVALLNDITTSEEVMKGLGEASGYSITENEKYMQTLTAQVNQLIAALKELAVQAGEQGLMDISKTIIQTATGLVKLTKNLGGVITVGTALFALIIKIKTQKIADEVTGVTTATSTLTRTLNMLLLKTKGTTVAVKGMRTAVASTITVLSTFAIAWSTLSMAVSYFSNKIQEAKEKAIESSSAYSEQSKGIFELRKEYEELTKGMTDEELRNADLSKIKNELIRKYGIEKDAVDQLNISRKEGIELLKKEEQLKIKSAYYEIAEELEKAKKEMTDFGVASSNVATISQKTKDILSTFGLGLGIDTSSPGSSAFGAKIKIIPDESINDVVELKAKLQEASLTLKQAGEDTSWLDSIIKEITKSTEKWGESYAKLGTQAEYIVKADDRFEKLRDNVKDVESFERFKEATINAADGFEPLIELIEMAVDEMFPEFSSGLGSITEAIDGFALNDERIQNLADTFKNLGESIDSTQGSLSTVYQVMEEYNSQQYLSIDTLQKILGLGAEYIQMLDFTANGVRINDEYTRDLMRTKTAEINALIDTAEANSIVEIAQEYLTKSTEDVKNANERLAPVVDDTASRVRNLAQEFVNGAVSAESFVSALAGEGFNNRFADELKNRIKGIQGVYDNLRRRATTESKAWGSFTENVAKSFSKAEKERLNKQKEAIKDKYQAEIDALKKVEKENDRVREKEEYYRKRREAEDDIEKARTRSGVEYREQESEARQKLEDLDREWQEKLKDWSIDDKVAELEALRDAELATIDAQIKRIGNATATIAKNNVETNSVANKQMLENYKEDYLEPIAQETATTYASIFDVMPTAFADANGRMLDLAKWNSVQLYNIYNSNFIGKMRQDLIGLQMQMISLGGASFSGLPIGNAYGLGNTNNTYNNTTSNSNVYANIYGNNTAKSFGNSIFTKP